MRRRRRRNKGSIVILCLMLVIAAAGLVFAARYMRTEHRSVRAHFGAYAVQSHEGLLAKDTKKKLKQSLYVPRKIDTSKKLIAFSFDDGPKRGNTERILEALDKQDFRASFFILGQNAKEYPDIVEKIYKSGNEVSGHSWSHPLLTKLSQGGIKEQQDKMNDAISKACGTTAVSFRPPYGGINDNVKQVIDGPLILWSVDTLDWKTRNAKNTEKVILEKAKDGDIVLMHDIHKQTVEAVENVLPILKEKGYEVCTVSELLEAKGVKAGKGDVVISAHQVN